MKTDMKTKEFTTHIIGSLNSKYALCGAIANPQGITSLENYMIKQCPICYQMIGANPLLLKR